MAKDVRCGTCRFWMFGVRSYCGWEPDEESKKVSAAVLAGGLNHAMWADDGKDCTTWESMKKARKSK